MALWQFWLFLTVCLWGTALNLNPKQHRSWAIRLTLIALLLSTIAFLLAFAFQALGVL